MFQAMAGKTWFLISIEESGGGNPHLLVDFALSGTLEGHGDTQPCRSSSALLNEPYYLWLYGSSEDDTAIMQPCSFRRAREALAGYRVGVANGSTEVRSGAGTGLLACVTRMKLAGRGDGWFTRDNTPDASKDGSRLEGIETRVWSSNPIWLANDRRRRRLGA